MIAEEFCKLLDGYVEKVANARDQVLFAEAVEAAKVLALRAAYITLWLSCVESLRRRFQELGIRDFAAAEMVSKLEDLEAQRLPIDQYLLQQARKFGLVAAKDYSKLEQISALQRVYSRPYERQPKLQEFLVDAGAVVDGILGQPTTIEASQLFDKIHLIAKEVETLKTMLRQPAPQQNANSN